MVATITPTKGHAAAIIEACKAERLLRNECAYVLATAQWETAHTMEPVREAYWLSEAWRKNNLRYYPWYGRGFVQLTWRDNYERAQARLGLGTMLTDNPDAAMEPDIAADILVLGMKEGWFTGKKLSDYITLQRSDFRNARRIVNAMDKADQIATLAEDYDDWLLGDGYGVESEEPEAPQVSEEVAALVRRIDDLEERLKALEEWRHS